MSRAKLVCALPWRENIGEANVKGTYALLLCRKYSLFLTIYLHSAPCQEHFSKKTDIAHYEK